KSSNSVELLSQSKDQFIHFCHAKHLAENAVQSAGGQLARHKNDIVIAFPVHGEDDQDVGHTLYEAYGGTISKWNPRQQITEQIKNKTIKT
ncbi:MAG: hypothetical protein AAFN70_16875, partial [Planctomycetota bacterium]